jgi:D-serine deaminase-like pyridoxal phosphate-dependent protein
MNPSDTWYQIDELKQIDSPALIIFKERIQHNIDQMIRIAGHPERLMPHIKTYKMIEIVRMQINCGLHSFKAATIPELELLAMAQAKEALLAFQPSAIKLKRLINLIKNYPNTNFSTIIDNIETAAMIDGILKDHHLNLDVYIDINNGNNRTGIRPHHALELYDKCLKMYSIHISGLHVYDGHIRIQDFMERKKACDLDFEPVNDLAHQIRSEKQNDLKIIAGSSPTFPVHAQRKKVICSPGTTLLWDAGYGTKFTDMPFLPAALLLTRVVSVPGNQLLCLDLGHKAIAAENPLENRVRFLNVAGLKPVSQSEEHLVVKNIQHASLKPGDLLYGIPYHICPTTALYDEVVVVEKDKVIDRWKVLARNRTINY